MLNAVRRFWGIVALLGIGLLLLYSLAPSTAESPAAFGPETFVREQGAPRWLTRKFDLP
jgi:hypothetical protein